MGYIPRQDGELASWARNFATRIAEDPGRYELSVAQAGEIAAAVNNFVAAHAIASSPATRTAAAVVAKKAAAAAMLPLLRGYAMRIKARRSIAAADKVNLGINLTRKGPPIAAPDSAPSISLDSGQPLHHKLVFRDVAGGGRPRGASGVQIYCHLGPKPPRNPMEARLLGFCGRDRYTAKFELSAAGERAHYWARWQTRRGLVGPWSQRVSLIVAG